MSRMLLLACLLLAPGCATSRLPVEAPADTPPLEQGPYVIEHWTDRGWQPVYTTRGRLLTTDSPVVHAIPRDILFLGLDDSPPSRWPDAYEMRVSFLGSGDRWNFAIKGSRVLLHPDVSLPDSPIAPPVVDLQYVLRLLEPTLRPQRRDDDRFRIDVVQAAAVDGDPPTLSRLYTADASVPLALVRLARGTMSMEDLADWEVAPPIVERSGEGGPDARAWEIAAADLAESRIELSGRSSLEPARIRQLLTCRAGVRISAMSFEKTPQRYLRLSGLTA